MKRVVLDSNIYISALNFGGQPLRMVDMAIAGEIEVAISQPLLAEVVRVLRDKFGWAHNEVEDAQALIRSITMSVVPTQTLDVVKADPDDNRVLECAVTAASDVIVTGDTDLLSLRNYGDIDLGAGGHLLRAGPGEKCRRDQRPVERSDNYRGRQRTGALYRGPPAHRFVREVVDRLVFGTRKPVGLLQDVRCERDVLDHELS